MSRPSIPARLGRQLRNSLTSAGVPRSTYVGRGTGLVTRSDLGTLNMSDVPVALNCAVTLTYHRRDRRMECWRCQQDRPGRG